MEAEALIAAIAAAPEDEAAWLVYADWLLDRSDPRGELISLQPAADAGDPTAIERIRALLMDEDRLLSPRLRAETAHWWFDWKRGFIARAELRPDGGPPTRESLLALLDDPHACLVSELDLHTKNRRPDHEQRIYEIGECQLAQLSRLESLVLRDLRLTSLEHDDLRRLATDAHACPALVTGEFRLPRLESLYLGSPAGTFASRRSILRRPPATLRELSLDGSDAQTIGQVVELEIAGQLAHLFIDAGTFAAVASLRDHAAGLPSIASVGFGDIVERATAEDVEALRAELAQALPGVKLYLRWEEFTEEPFVDPEPEPAPVDEALAAWRREFIKS